MCFVNTGGRIETCRVEKENAAELLREVKAADTPGSGASYALRMAILERSGGSLSSAAAFTYDDVATADLKPYLGE